MTCRRRGISPQHYITDLHGRGRLRSTTIDRLGELTLANCNPPSSSTS